MKSVIKLISSLLLVVMFSTLKVEAKDAAPSFKEGSPVWPKGQATERNLFLGFRTSFESAKGDRPILRITGCSSYRISLNGRHVGYGPARATKGFFRVDEITLNPKVGENTLAIEVAGYNCQSYYHMNQPSFLQAEIELNGRIIAATGVDGKFKAGLLPRVQKVVRYSFQRTYSEEYRLTKDFDDWKLGKGSFKELPLERQKDISLLPRRVSYVDFAINGPFKPMSRGKTFFDSKKRTHGARFVDDKGPNGIANAFLKNELESNWWDLIQRYSVTNRSPLKSSSKARFSIAEGESILFDAGLNDTGFPGLRVTCSKPGKIAFKFDEILVKGEVSPTRNGTVNVVVWEFKEPGEYSVEAFEPYTFRYADVIACSGALEIDAPYLRTYKNSDTGRAKLVSSDSALVKIFDAARQTYAQNAVDVFTDCPGRERAGWLCDSFFTSRSSLLFTGDLQPEHLFLENYVLPKKFDYLPDGALAMCYPGDFPNGNFIPNWMMWLVVEIEEFRERGGDENLIKAFRPRLEALVNYLSKFRNSDGLLENLPAWIFVEWSRANQLVRNVNYPSNMMWAEVLDVMNRLYGRKDLAEEAAKIRETVRRQSWNGQWFCDNAVRGKDGALRLSGECTETCQYYAFYFRTATPQSHPELWKTMVEDFGPKRKQTKKHPKIWPSNAFIGNYLRLECLSREGLSSQILDEMQGFFLYMAERTGTLWEHDRTSASCCHGFASHVAVTYLRDIVGVRKIDYRQKTVTFSPPKDLKIESISMEIPLGKDEIMVAGWKKENGKIVETLKLPPTWSRK
jgi:alpha-L-rhamnosidase